MQDIFNRVELLLGRETMKRITSCRIMIVGVGGVGSWCAESLVRSGIGHLTIVDSDSVCASNINRQLMATTATVGRAKVDVLRERLLEINPDTDVTAMQRVYRGEDNAFFRLDDYDYIIDCIDSLKDKMALLLNATATKAAVFSSMGAALKMDPSQIKVAEYWKVRGCPLARALRERFKRTKCRPAKKFLCVFSEELLQNRGEAVDDGSDTGIIHKAQVNGSLAHITGIFGFTLAGLIINEIWKKEN